MAFLDILIGVFTLANTFIALFIVVYAFLFLNKTKRHKDRRPWDYLFLASMIYLTYTLFLIMLQIYNVRILFSSINLYELSVFFQFIYTGLILLAFISQTDLIFNNEVIIIMKKENQGKEQAEVAVSHKTDANVAPKSEEEKDVILPAAPKTGLETVVSSHKSRRSIPSFQPNSGKKVVSKKGSSRKVAKKSRNLKR